MNLSRSAIKRAANPARACRWSTDDSGCGRCSECDGVRDAIDDACRAMKRGKHPTTHPDPPDYFGVCLSDCENGRRYLEGYNFTVGLIRRRMGVLC